jgi:cytochrome c551/c552
MKSIIASMVVTAGLMVAGSALAADMPDLAKKSGCTACHAIDKKVVGPAWADVAKAYASNGATSTGVKVSDILAGKSAAEYLEHKVAAGGKGNWGTAAMIANSPKVSEADIKELVKFVLSLK